jgi:dCMP deaminase
LTFGFQAYLGFKVLGLESELFIFDPHHGSRLKARKKKFSHPQRPSWDEYFMDITHLVAKRSTCLRRQVGAILVKDKKILATGYNGAPSRLEHCLDIGCLREKLNIPSGERHELCRGLHGEQNAIIQAAYHGVEIRGATLYCTNHPCIICSKMIINAGIERVIYEEGYADELARGMLKESGIKVEKFERKQRVAGRK